MLSRCRTARARISPGISVCSPRVSAWCITVLIRRMFRPVPQIARNPMRLMATCSADAPLKGLRYLLRAYASLLARLPELELLLVSKPQPGGKTEQLLARLGIADRVQFVTGISTRADGTITTRRPQSPWCPRFTRVSACPRARPWPVVYRWFPPMAVPCRK